jgi:hypothetical protein
MSANLVGSTIVGWFEKNEEVPILASDVLMCQSIIIFQTLPSRLSPNIQMDIPILM